MRSHLTLFATGLALAAAGSMLDGWRWPLWAAGALAIAIGLTTLPRRVASTRRGPTRRDTPAHGGVRYRTGDRPGPGRYRCELCSWVVQLDDDPEEVSTGPSVTTLEPEVRPGDASLPVCLGCGGMEAPIFERVRDEVPGRATSPSVQRPTANGRHNGAGGRPA